MSSNGNKADTWLAQRVVQCHGAAATETDLAAE